eukprot:2606599-Amphidinium_carterae.1
MWWQKVLVVFQSRLRAPCHPAEGTQLADVAQAYAEALVAQKHSLRHNRSFFHCLPRRTPSCKLLLHLPYPEGFVLQFSQQSPSESVARCVLT